MRQSWIDKIIKDEFLFFRTGVVMKKFMFTILIILCLIVFVPQATASDTDLLIKLNQDIQLYIDISKSKDSEKSEKLARSIIEQTEILGDDATDLIVQKIKDPNTSEHALTVSVWVAGFTRDPNLIDTLIDIHINSSIEIIKQNALRSMASIGSNKAGEYLLAIAQKTPLDPEESTGKPNKFNILDLLATMQYEKAIPEMECVLKLDHKEYYWQSIFCYGKMGDKSIPYLIKKIDDSNVDTRFNAINLLGQILIATEATEPLCKQYLKEKDTEIKLLILSSLEKIMPDLSSMKKFFENVAANEQNAELKKFAEETVSNMKQYIEMASKFKQKSKPDRALFDAEYKQLYKSAGKEGSIANLGTYSTTGDELSLKKLKQRFLDRNSDECFYDYEEVNVIIMMHRIIAQNKDLIAAL